jgi:hypothetical protein
MKRKISEHVKNIIYSTALIGARMYWRVVKPRTYGASVLLVFDDKVLLVQPRSSHY